MTAEAWVAILAVACVGLLLIAVVALTGWKRAQDLLDDAICDREFVWGIAFETAEQRDDAREDLRVADEMNERVSLEVEVLGAAFAQMVHEANASRRESHEARVAARLALSFYGRAVTDADQLDLMRVERDGLRADLDDARAALEEN